MREIRVIDDTGAQLGIMPPPQALAIAKQKGLDLVEISPTASPPVCRIMDFGKYQYQEQKRAREARQHQKVIEVKEIKFRPKVDEHDYQFKKKHIERFLEDGDKVKATIFFRGREMAHPEIGRRILERLVDELRDVAIAETMPRMEGNQMHTILTRRPQTGGGKAQAGGEANDDDVERNDAQTEDQDAPRRRETVQANQARKVPAEQGVQAAHPEQQDDQPEAKAQGHGRCGGRGRAEARAHAALQIGIRDSGFGLRK